MESTHRVDYIERGNTSRKGEVQVQVQAQAQAQVQAQAIHPPSQAHQKCGNAAAAAGP